MAGETVWRHWRRKVHDILEVGGDAHPAAHAVTAFIVALIVLNAVAFAAETDSVEANARQKLQRSLGTAYSEMVGGSPPCRPRVMLDYEALSE